jgi:hypothetical protein
MAFCLADEGSYGDAVLRGVAGVGGSGGSSLVVPEVPTHTPIVIPAKAGIQYAAAYRSDRWRLWNTGSSAFADDSRGYDTTSRSRGLICPRLAIEFPQPSKQRAQGMPGARCTRGLVCKSVQKGAHEHTGSAEASDIPCAMALRLISCSPRRAGLVVTVVSGIASTNLTPASGRQDHTTLPYAFVTLGTGRQLTIRAATH